MSKHQVWPGYGEWRSWRGTGRLDLSHETKFSGVNGDREIFIFPVQLITSRFGNHTRLMYSLLNVPTIHLTCIHIYCTVVSIFEHPIFQQLQLRSSCYFFSSKSRGKYRLLVRCHDGKTKTPLFRSSRYNTLKSIPSLYSNFQNITVGSPSEIPLDAYATKTFGTQQ